MKRSVLFIYLFAVYLSGMVGTGYGLDDHDGCHTDGDRRDPCHWYFIPATVAWPGNGLPTRR